MALYIVRSGAGQKGAFYGGKRIYPGDPFQHDFAKGEEPFPWLRPATEDEIAEFEAANAPKEDKPVAEDAPEESGEAVPLGGIEPREVQILDALKRLEDSNPKHWRSSSGRPDVKVVNRFLRDAGVEKPTNGAEIQAYAPSLVRNKTR